MQTLCLVCLESTGVVAPGGCRRKCCGNEKFWSDGAGAMLINVKMGTRSGIVRNVLETFMDVIVNRNVRIEENGQAGWSVQVPSRNDSIDVSIKKKDVSHCHCEVGCRL